ncbi:hypothetical protein Tsubulata_050976, partial [Turnera subulata]
RRSGTVIKVRGAKVYVPQRAWIQTGTIRDNVLFGKDMDKDFYEIKCGGNGDLTVVGERGINLSGGQKQRIQLARAVYGEMQIMTPQQSCWRAALLHFQGFRWQNS